MSSGGQGTSGEEMDKLRDEMAAKYHGERGGYYTAIDFSAGWTAAMAVRDGAASPEVEKLKAREANLLSVIDQGIVAEEALEAKLAAAEKKLRVARGALERIVKASGHGSFLACHMWAGEALAKLDALPGLRISKEEK